MKKWLLAIWMLVSGCMNVKAPEIPAPDLPIVEEKGDIVLSFVAVGDNLIHGAVYHEAKVAANQYDFKPMYEAIKPYVQSADVAFVNQETILGGKAMGLSHYPQFNSPEEVAEALVDTGFDLVNHASNHSLDKREKGIINSLNTWDQYDTIVVAGINRSSEEKVQQRILERSGIRLGFLAYTEHTNGIPLPANKDYLVNLISEDRIQNDVQAIQNNIDLLLVSMHWGTENSHFVNQMQKDYTSKLCSWGVDVVIGTHPHVIQPVELIECDDHQMLVMYSLGNFLSAQDRFSQMIEGMMSWSVRFDGNTLEPSFEQVAFIPLMNHFNRGFTNFKVYTWKDYSDDLLNKHGLQGYNSQSLNRQKYETKIREVVGDEVAIIFE